MNKEQIIIEKLTAADVDELRSISINTFYESFIGGNTEENMQQYMRKFFSTEKLLEELKDPHASFYFARLNGKAIGYLKLNFGNAQTELQENNGLEIERIYIIKEFHGNNIGQLLFDKALSVANEKAVDYVWLGVWEKNTGAIRFYERNGMLKFATHPFMLGEDLQTDLMMRMEIRGRVAAILNKSISQ